MNGLLKVNAQDSDDYTDCLSEGTKLFSAWGPLLIRWVKERLATGESDEELEDFNIFGPSKYEETFLQDSFLSLTENLAYKCNYAATVEGLLANKMLVDTVWALPKWFPFWLKSICFFLITLPVNFFTLIDDALGTWILY